MEYVEVVGIFTHYSTADEIDKSYTNMQTSLFEKAVNTAKELGIQIPYIHSSNSAGSMELSNTFQNMVRVGIECTVCIHQKWIIQSFYSLRCR